MHIKSIKKKGSEYLIILDDETLKVNEEVLINNNILYSKKLSNKDIKKIKEETVYYENYSKALKMINRKMRSEKIVERVFYSDGILQGRAFYRSLYRHRFRQYRYCNE